MTSFFSSSDASLNASFNSAIDINWGFQYETILAPTSTIILKRLDVGHPQFLIEQFPLLCLQRTAIISLFQLHGFFSVSQ